jgi:hypothetical protein
MSGSSQITASYTVPSTAGLLSAINISAGTTSGNLSAVTFSNANGISFGLNASTVTASYTVPTVPAQFTGGFSTQGNTSGNTGMVTGQMLLVGTNNITLSGSTNGGSITISISGGAGAAGNTGYISAGGATASLGTVVFSNSNGVSFGVNGQTVTATVAAQSNQQGTVYASSNTFGTSSGTYDARTLSIAGSGNCSVAASNSGWVVSVPNQTNQSGNVYASSNTFGTSSGTYDARSLSIAGSGIVSVAASNSGFVINATTAAQTNQSGNVYASSNTFGTSSGTYDARSVSIAGAGIVSVAASNSGWVISASVAAQTNQSLGMYAVGTTGGQSSSSTLDARSVTVSGFGPLSLGFGTSSILVSLAGALYAPMHAFLGGI